MISPDEYERDANMLLRLRCYHRPDTTEKRHFGRLRVAMSAMAICVKQLSEYRVAARSIVASPHGESLFQLISAPT